MLEPGQRQLFPNTLRPPDGYVLDLAIGTTFTLDLMALLSVPLAFTFRDTQDDHGQPTTDPLSLLEGARRYANKVVVFCHGGRIGVPRSGQSALAFIEQSVVTVLPQRGRAGSVFHPKVWVLRYTARADGGTKPVKYRLLCQSRNLTFDSSWDTSLVLDGELVSGRDCKYPVNRPLADFVKALPTLALEPISDMQAESIALIGDELRRVCFVPPTGLKLSRFLSFGLGDRNSSYPDLRYRPLLVISPFLDGEFLRRIAHRRPHSVLISRRDALLTAPSEAICAFDEVYAFRSGLELEPEDAEDSQPPLAGLHAKIFVIDDGWNVRVGIGSANATGAALGNPPRNVEFMVELVGRKARFGIKTLLAPRNPDAAGTFRDLIEEFDKDEAGTEAEDEEAIQLDRMLDESAETLTRTKLAGTVDVSSCGRFSLRLELDQPPDLAVGIGTVTCRPATLAVDRGRPLKDGQEFVGLLLEELSAFLAIEVRASIGRHSGTKRFVRTIRLDGLPEDRLPRLIAGMLSDRARFLRLLWLLLAPDQDMSFAEFDSLLSNQGTGTGWSSALPGLLERMLETLGSDPGKFDAVASLIDDLRRTEAGTELIGKDFDAIWDALWTVRGRQDDRKRNSRVRREGSP